MGSEMCIRDSICDMPFRSFDSFEFALFFSYRYVIFRLRKAHLLPFVQKERHMASTSDLSPAERQRFIMNWLAEKPNISVSDIVRRFRFRKSPHDTTSSRWNPKASCVAYAAERYRFLAPTQSRIPRSASMSKSRPRKPSPQPQQLLLMMAMFW